MHTDDGRNIPYGFLTYTVNGDIIESESGGCEIIGKDTVNENERYSLEIKNYRTFNAEIKKMVVEPYDSLFMGDFSSFVIQAEDDRILYDFKPTKSGYNLFIGKVYLQRKKDNVTTMYPVYKLFYVKGKDEK